MPLLQSQADSKELFVAEYAARALAQIDGTPLKAIDHHADLAADLNLFPAETGIVGQTTGIGIPGFTLNALVTQMQAMQPHAGPMPAGGQPQGPVLNQNAAVDDMTKKVLDFAERIGNVRADGMSLAVSGDINGNGNGGHDWFIASFHGEYDREAVAMFAANNRANGTPTRNGDMISVSMDREVTMLFPSNHQFIFVLANPQNTPAAMIIDPLTTAALNGGKGTLPARTRSSTPSSKPSTKQAPLDRPPACPTRP